MAGSSAAAAPELAAVVVVGRLRERAGGCLRSLFAQGLGDRLEIVLVDCAGPEARPVPGSEDPRVRSLAAPPGASFAAARALGVGLVRAPVTAFVEEHCRARPGWAEAILAAHREPWAGVGSGIENANPGVGRSDIAGLLAYGYWYPPQRRGEVEFLPGQNATFKTEVLRGLADELPRLLVSDLVLHARLRRAGHRLFLEPAATLAHLNETTLASRSRGLYYWYRLYACRRAEEEEWGWPRKLLYVVAAPVVPFYFLAHFLPFIARTRPRFLGLLLRSLPYVVVNFWVAGAGQAMGLLRGPGDAEARFSDFEMHAPRPEAPGEATGAGDRRRRAPRRRVSKRGPGGRPAG